ncbi:MAG: DUF2934 domain-containing protein [Sedimentisphaerales bacterium]|nr:DUF2934 domain-containing protein [Sedimentisphaerales bacterium]
MAKKTTYNYQGNDTQKMNASNKKSKAGSNIKAINPPSAITTSSSKATNKIVALTHEQIAERAKNIWMNRGCPKDQDEKNWQEAENQLKQELGIH